jgi:anaerobic selenocysteine-containing dehydrogenase
MMLRGGGPNGDPAVVDEELLAGVLHDAVADEHSPIFGRSVSELRALVQGTNAPDRLVDALVRTGPWGDWFGADPDGLNLQRLLDHPHGIDFGPLEPRLPSNLRTPSARVELAPEEILAVLPELLVDEPPSAELMLIGRRHLRSNNSWMHNLNVLVKGRDRCTLLIHPLDASERGLDTGDLAEVSSSIGRVEVAVEVSDELMPGVVSLPHGWGHDVEGTRLSIARTRPGVNMNVLIDGHVLDPISGNARINGVPVRVVAMVKPV